jgi:hypothetical protein
MTGKRLGSICCDETCVSRADAASARAIRAASIAARTSKLAVRARSAAWTSVSDGACGCNSLCECDCEDIPGSAKAAGVVASARMNPPNAMCTLFTGGSSVGRGRSEDLSRRMFHHREIVEGFVQHGHDEERQ